MQIHGKLVVNDFLRTGYGSGSAHLDFVYCVWWKRKLCRDVRSKERNPSHSFHRYQLHSSPILPYQMTSSAIMARTFPPVQECSMLAIPYWLFVFFYLLSQDRHTDLRFLPCLRPKTLTKDRKWDSQTMSQKSCLGLMLTSTQIPLQSVTL